MDLNIAHPGAWGLAIIMIDVASWLFCRHFAPKRWREWAGAGLVQVPRASQRESLVDALDLQFPSTGCLKVTGTFRNDKTVQ